MSRWQYILGFSACLGLSLGTQAVVAGQAELTNVLILQSLEPRSNPYDHVTKMFREQVENRYGGSVSLVEVGLDARWGDRNERELLQFELLQLRIDSQPPDLVVALGPSAVDFWRQYRKKISAPIPAIFATREGLVTADSLQTGDAGIVSEFSFTGTVDDIVALLPDTGRIVVVFGAAELERAHTAAARSVLASYEQRIEFIFTSDLSMTAIEGLVAGLPPDSAVLFGILSVDSAGLNLPGNTGLKRVVAASNAPVFGVFTHDLGDGIVGGRLIPTTRMAEEMAAAAFRLLDNAGEEPTFLSVALTEPVYDQRALDRWHIAVANLPPSSRIEFATPSFWSQYGGWVLLVAAVLVTQTALISTLLVQRRRRRFAELAGSRLSRRLISAHEDERWRIARELHDDLSQRLAGLGIDAGMLSKGTAAGDQPQVLKKLQEELLRISKNVHDMSYRLHPSMVGDLGLVTALRSEVDRTRRQSECRVDAQINDLETKPSREVALCLYRIAQQAIQNALRHADPDHISISLDQDGDSIRLEVRDDGAGFNVRELEHATGIGISSMRERARSTGGTLHLHSERGKGTTVVVTVPAGGVEA